VIFHTVKHSITVPSKVLLARRARGPAESQFWQRTPNLVALHKIAMILCSSIRRPRVGISTEVIRIIVPGTLPGATGSHRF